MNSFDNSLENVKIEYAREALIPSFYDLLNQVAKEEIYIEMIEAPEYESVEKFQVKLIDGNKPVFYATFGERVVGWVDISQSSNPRLQHRGGLGMGVHKDFRSKGIGSGLLQNSLQHARQIGLEKVELSVYTINHAAIGLYKKFGFTEIGVIKNYRKLRDRYFDVLEMELFL